MLGLFHGVTCTPCRIVHGASQFETEVWWSHFEMLWMKHMLNILPKDTMISNDQSLGISSLALHISLPRGETPSSRRCHDVGRSSQRQDFRKSVVSVISAGRIIPDDSRTCCFNCSSCLRRVFSFKSATCVEFRSTLAQHFLKSAQLLHILCSYSLSSFLDFNIQSLEGYITLTVWSAK